MANDLFVLMQDPLAPDLDNPLIGYHTIGLRSKYPDKGFGGCNRYGQSDFTRGKKKVSWFAFIDDESKLAFEGPIESKHGYEFARVEGN